MTRKLLPLVSVLGLLAAACAEPPNPTVDFGSGTRFVPMVADSLNDTGLHPSVVVGPEGNPVVAYFAFPEEVPEGVLREVRPVGAPSIPGVMMATASPEGLWTRGAMALERQIPNVQIPFEPAFDPVIADLTKDGVTGLQLVADGETFHAVWGSADGLFYATGSLDPNAGSQVELEKVADTPPVGPSIAVDGDGTPWISFYTSTSTAASVELATPDGRSWSVDTIAEAAGCQTCRTATVVGPDGVSVAYSEGGSGVFLATHDPENAWTSVEVAADGGQGLSATATADGYAMAFYDPAGQVAVLSGGSPGSFRGRPASEADPSADSATAAGAGTSIAVDDDGTLWVAWHDARTGIAFASGDGETFTPIDTGASTRGGVMPSVAVTPDGSVAYVSWYDPDTQDLLVGAYGDLTGLAIAGQPGESQAPTGPTGPTTPPPSEECTPVVDGRVTVVAEGIRFTDGRCIQAQAGEPFTIVFDNRDSGVQHNVQVFAGPEPTGDLLEGSWDIITGPDTIEYEVPALDAGEHAYNCVVHPNMVGTIRVVEGGGEGGGAGGGGTGAAITVTAANIAFDTSTITLVAGQENVVTLVNEDAGVQHNIAIFRDDSLSEELFNGELITGPARIDYTIPPLEAGEYYFLCIVHPNMNGTVIVE